MKKQLSIKVDMGLAGRLAAEAKANGTSVTATMVDILEDYFSGSTVSVGHIKELRSLAIVQLATMFVTAGNGLNFDRDVAGQAMEIDNHLDQILKAAEYSPEKFTAWEKRQEERKKKKEEEKMGADS